MRDPLAGGFEELVFFTGVGDTLRTSTVAGGAVPTEDVSHVTLGDGTRAVKSRKWRFDPQLASAEVIERLRRWQEAGKRIGVIGVGATPLLWRELVPVHLETPGADRGELSGKTLRMETRLLEARVERSADLLAGVEGEVTSSGATAWRAALPLPGELVRVEAREAGDVTVRFYDDSGTQVGTDTATLAVDEPLYVDVPAQTQEIEAETSGARPRALLDADTFALTLEKNGDGTRTLTTFGRGLFERAGQIDVEVGGTVYTLGRTYDLTPRALGDQRISRPDDETLRVTHDT